MKKKYSSLFIILALSFSITVSVHAEDAIPETTAPESIEIPENIPAPEEIEEAPLLEIEEIQTEDLQETTTTSTDAQVTEEIIATPTTTLPTVSARLYVVANGNILFNETLTVTACKPYEASTEYTLNAKCLVDQAPGLTSTWNFFGTDAFLDSINGVHNDFSANNFWGYFINLEYGSIALNAYTLIEGDEILIQYNTIPLKIELSTTSPHVGDSVIVSIYEFGLDTSWNPVWLPSTNSTISINGIEEIPSSNTTTLSITTVEPYTILVSKSGYVTTERTITAREIPVTPPPTSPGGGSGGGGSCCTTKNPVEQMIAFLDAKQNADGSFGSSAFVSDWAAIAYGAWTGEQMGKSKLSTYLLTDPNPLDGPNHTTNYARRAMGLMSLGINPYTGTKTNYIQAILDGYDGNQFGDAGLVNDDIFALVPLLKAGYTAQDQLIVSTTKHIIASQNQVGSFGSVDLTAAGIQALSMTSGISGVEEALTKAKAYLKSIQGTDGSFGNVYATGWTLQAIQALGETAETWKMGDNSGITYITKNQDTDGGLLSGDILTNRIWATSYAIPGVLEKKWGSILSGFNKPSTVQNPTNTGAIGTTTTTTPTPTVTSTAPVTTSTIFVTTTQTENPITTSTPEVAVVIEEENVIVPEEANTIQVVTYREPVVLGERIENTEIVEEKNTQPLTEEVIELQDQGEVIETPKPKSNTNTYIFIISLTIFILLTGYMGISRKSSKK